MPERILIADVGTTFTKVSLLERNAGKWHILDRATAPTTVDVPELDVMSGLRSAIQKLQSWTGVKLLAGRHLVSPSGDSGGIDWFAATSSAGGGLQVLVAGLTEKITAESGHRAALGAGAVVTNVISLNQANTELRSLEQVRNIPCDMILVTGGTDGGNISDVLALAEFISLAAPEPRFKGQTRTPLVYAGNIDAQPYLKEIIGDSMDVICVENIRPTMERESLQPVREAIQKIFLEHVMSNAPGFKTLALWARGKVKPTPVAIGSALTRLASRSNQDVLAVDVGGATTDVFSMINGQFYRSVLANVGMSHSMGSILQETKPEFISRWLPMDEDDGLVRNWHLNKMIRPTTLPQTMEELMLEQAFAREAIRLSLKHHRSLVTGLKGIKIQRQVGDVFTQHGTGNTLVDLLRTGAVVGLGGVISNAPRRSQAVSMVLDGIQPEGVTDIYLDEGAFLPYAGTLCALSCTEEPVPGIDALSFAATCIAPVGPRIKLGTPIATVRFGGSSHDIVAGEISVVRFESPSSIEVEITPRRDFDAGAGKGNPVQATVLNSHMGLILDGRGRPLSLPQDNSIRKATLGNWYETLGIYPGEAIMADARKQTYSGSEG
jgi:uncharacterized protein (TIGR01319 family)